jgi:hypothetical protein
MDSEVKVRNTALLARRNISRRCEDHATLLVRAVFELLGGFPVQRPSITRISRGLCLNSGNGRLTLGEQE